LLQKSICTIEKNTVYWGCLRDEMGHCENNTPTEFRHKDEIKTHNSILNFGLSGQGRWGYRVFAHPVDETARFVRGALKLTREPSSKHHSEFYIPLDVNTLAVRSDDRVQFGWAVQQHRPCTSAALD